MFNKDFYPTPEAVTLRMLEGHNITGKVILEPSAGKGNIVDVLKDQGAAEVLTCEINADLRAILGTKSRIIGNDFLTVTSNQISHIDMIVMNPPFSADERHILHAYEIAPAGCKIISLCNLTTITRPNFTARQQVVSLIEQYGRWENLQDCFTDAERVTGVEIALINLQKPGGQDYKTEFEGFFMDETPEAETGAGLMPYNVIRDLVNRYISAVKLFDKQLELGVQMNGLTSSFYGTFGFSVSEKEKPKTRNDFKKDLQKAAWNFIFDKMNLKKYATQGLKDDINKFVETQQNIPFSMPNVYRMLDIVIGTTGQRMDKALLEVFEKVTSRSDDNKMKIEGWKTNSYYLLTEKFILPYMVEVSYRGEMKTTYRSESLIEDMQKALCYITGMDYDECTRLDSFISKNRCDWGQWYSWGFFEIRGYKKGTMHFKFQNKDLWGQFNQRIAKIKGFPLYEHKPKPTPPQPPTVNPVVLLTLSL